MRKLTKKIFALLGSFALAAALVSCGDIATGDETQNLSETNGKARVIVNIESGLRSATLLPSDLTEDDITEVRLSAKKVDDGKREVDPSEEFDLKREWKSTESKNAISQMKAATDIIVDIATYDFELSLYKSSEKGISILCESARLTQAMHLGNNTLNFAAKYVSDENATGSLEVNFKFEKEDYVENIGVEFYKAGDETSAQKENVYIYNKTNENDTFTAKYSMSGLEAGDYILKFYVYGLYPDSRGADTSDLINTYQKLVRIAPFCKTFAEIKLDNLNSFYIVKFVLPDGVESHLDEAWRSRNASYILPDEDYFLGSWPFHKFIGWYDNEKFEGEPVYYIEQGTKVDKTFYAKFEEDSLLVIDDISTLDTLGEQLAAANEAGLKSVTVKITDEIPLDPLGENWMEDAIVYDDSSDKMEYKYTSKAFAQITSVLEDFMKSTSTSDSEEYNGMKIELDLTETGISYLPTCAFRFRSLRGDNSDWTDAYLGCLTAVKLPDTVTAILPNALQLTGITSFKIPEKVIGIGSSAFELCQNLPNVTIPAGVTEIGWAAFADCDSLEVVDFAEGSECKTIGDGAFCECSNLKSITIPAGVTEIGNWAFEECVGLGTVNFAKESKCKTIGGGAFSGCSNLKSITIPADVTEIGNAAFGGCNSLEFVNFAEGSKCTTIGVGAFSKCSNLKSIAIPAGVTKIGDGAFGGCGSLGTVSFAEGSKCTTIGEDAFCECSNLKSITIPAGVIEICNYAFDECENLTEINFAGTKEQWESLKKGKNIFPSQVKEIKCTDGEVEYTYVEDDEEPRIKI
ncbi:MAG: leucine-rich repeat domain-containing protein [Treponema sp.]|uniref:leucine-rich repeat domain-containing protein n=1 Tax=Treponema sp. TaxID=166 RepID=UPI002A91C081|nr:leucine-rich repeat domain-containing protein [Treponema sp.]MDY6396366.1 leucine-rich repeat domain-containing protein [Treponema sp.]